MMQIKNKLIYIVPIVSFIAGIVLSYNLLSLYKDYKINKIKETIEIEEEISQSDIAEQKSVINEQYGGIGYFNVENGEMPEVLISTPTPMNQAPPQEEEIISNNPYISIIENLTDEEIDLICKIAYKESGNQCEDGQRAVIQVILNRVMCEEHFADTVEGVLSAPRQFSTWAIRNEVSQEGIDLLKEKLDLIYMTEEEVFQKYIDEMGFENVKPTDYVYFGRDIRKEMKNCIQIQDHWFGTI